ncbi:MAG TPA: hypothetical protein VM142_05535 [Acidimicrobiales bacterium]|nr:hypothetical protein [Acidimicrobiales bacterium]
MLDAVKDLVEARLLGEALQFASQVLLEGLSAPLGAPLQGCMYRFWEITYENIWHACIMIAEKFRRKSLTAAAPTATFLRT